MRNREILDRALEELRGGLEPFVVGQVKQLYGDQWRSLVEEYARRPPGITEDSLDVSALLRILTDRWNELFRKNLDPKARGYASELRAIRNEFAHPSRGDDLSVEDTHRALDTMVRLLRLVSAIKEERAIHRLRELIPEVRVSPAAPRTPAHQARTPPRTSSDSGVSETEHHVGSRQASGDARGLAKRITDAFMIGSLDLSSRRGAPAAGWHGVPEVAVADHLRGAGKTDAEVRLFITFTAAMDRARDADRLWYASEKLFRDHPWLFQPREVATRPAAEMEGRLLSYGVSQRHRADVAGWRRIGTTLADTAAAPVVYRAIYDGKGDATELLVARQARGADGVPLFPFIQGPKIGPMWVRMLAYPGGAEITSLGILPVAVDVQVRKVTEYLGVTETRGQGLERVQQHIQDVWAEDVRRYGAVGPAALVNTAAALDPAIWFFGKWGCTRCEQAGRRVPISPICQECRFDDLRRR